MNAMPEWAIDVVILTWNDGTLLDAAVASVLGTTGPEVRVIVVDNASDPAATVVDDPRVLLVRNRTNRGVAGGRNDGVLLATAPLVCFLDSDAELREGSLSALRAPLDVDPTIAVAVPVFEGQDPQESAGLAPTLRRKVARMRGAVAEYEAPVVEPGSPWWDVEFGIGACQLIRRSVLTEVSGLDESMFWTEDLDFCLRVLAAGHRVVQVGTTRVHHPARRRYNKPLSRKGLHHGVALIRLLWRHRSTVRGRRAS